MNPHTPNTPVMELLEPRLAPAGVILLTTSGGVLTIVGNELDNSIKITNDLGSGWIIESAVPGTSFKLNGENKVGPFLIEAQNSIKATLGLGNDRIDILPADGGMVIEGTLSLDMGAGDDVVNLGSGASQTLVVRGATTINLGAGADDFELRANANFLGAVSLKAGTENDVVSFLGINGAAHAFMKGLTVDMGTGTDSLSIHSAVFQARAGAVSLKAGEVGQAQTLDFSPDSGFSEGAFTIAITGGDSTIHVGDGPTDSFRFEKGLTVTAGAGTDTLTVEGAVSVVGAMKVDLKAGTNTTTFDTGATFSAGSLNFKGGIGDDTVFFKGIQVTINGALAANLGSGINTIGAFAGMQMTVGSINQSGTTGNDGFGFEGTSLTVLGNANFGFGAGNNTVSLAATQALHVGGSLLQSGTAGNDFFSLGSLTSRFMGNVTLNLGNGSNIGNGCIIFGNASIGGNFTFKGGAADDTLMIASDSFQVSRTFLVSAGDAAVQNELTFGGNATVLGALTYQGGKLGDEVNVGGSGDPVKVLGNVSIKVGSGASQVEFQETQVLGSVTVTSVATALQADLISFTDSLIFGTTTVNMGAGVSTLKADDSNFIGAFTGNTGAGNDHVGLDESLGTNDPTYWYGAVKINLGAGTDSIAVGGGDADAANNFLKAVSFDGGTGTDTFTEFNSAYVLPGQPAKTHFE